MSDLAGIPDRLSAALSDIVGTNIITKPGQLVQYGDDISHFPASPPDAVVFPSTTSEVQAIVRACSESGTPILPLGAGTSVEGQILAVNGGVSISTARMDNVLAVHSEDMDVVVQPGLTRKRLNEDLRDTGLFFPIDPGADATLGGMASTRASGTNAVRYGTMKENTLSLEVVLPDGNIIRTRKRARKSSAGYDLTSLFVGSEGTLGIITELTLRVYGRPESTKAAICAFSDLSDAVDSVIQIIQIGLPVARIEILDEAAIDAVNAYSKLEIARAPTLFLEFHGAAAAVTEQVETAREILSMNNGQNFEWASSLQDRNKLWQARHDAAHAIAAYAPGTSQWWSDVCVPISNLAECIRETKEDIADSGLYAPLLGHVGDGNFHLGICADDNDKDAVRRADALHERLVKRAIAMDGTCTGEHGIGLGKKAFLKRELGDAVDLMKLIKTAIDPNHMMNPNKILDF